MAAEAYLADHTAWWLGRGREESGTKDATPLSTIGITARTPCCPRHCPAHWAGVNVSVPRPEPKIPQFPSALCLASGLGQVGMGSPARISPTGVCAASVLWALTLTALGGAPAWGAPLSRRCTYASRSGLELPGGAAGKAEAAFVG